MRIGFSQRRTAAYLHLWAALLSAWAILDPLRAPAAGRRVGSPNSLIVGAVGVVVVAASVWMVYTLEILKARHLARARARPVRASDEDAARAVGAGRGGPALGRERP